MEEEYHYGNLRSMRTEYLERTITKYIKEENPRRSDVYVTVHGDRDGLTLGDDKVEILMFSKRGNQISKDTHVSTICYEIAAKLACHG